MTPLDPALDRSTLTLHRPDDWHVHLRDGAMLAAVAPQSAGFGRVLAMPNLAPPVTTTAEGRAYKARIAAAAPGLEVHLAAYLTDGTDSDDLAAGYAAGVFTAAKWYPAGATTHSARGVTAVDKIRGVLDRMAEIGMPLCVHAEATDPAVDVFDRERVFLDRVLGPLLHRVPVRCVVEHATTRDAVQFVRAYGDGVVATITPHHLWWNRNALFDGGLRPHAYCLPVPKRERDRQALRAAATSGDPRFFAGTDSAPHPVHAKEADCGCAGVFNAPTAIAAYATVFDALGALDRLDGFLGVHGAAFYGLPPSDATITLTRAPFTPPLAIDAPGIGAVRVFLGGSTLPWNLSAGRA
ncbi:MAG: dihydroorotase [Myxococcota bacterium]